MLASRWRQMIGNAIRAWGWAALLQLLSATALTCGQGQPTAAGTGAQGSASSPSHGSYLGSRLMPPKSEGSCPPNVAPMYEADAIVTGTDMRQRPWGFAQTLRDVLVRSSGDPRLKDDPRTAELAVHADRFVACFNYVDMMAGVPLHDDQGTMIGRTSSPSISILPRSMPYWRDSAIRRGTASARSSCRSC